MNLIRRFLDLLARARRPDLFHRWPPETPYKWDPSNPDWNIPTKTGNAPPPPVVGVRRGPVGSVTLLFWGPNDWVCSQCVKPKLIDGDGWEDLKRESARSLDLAIKRAKERK